MRVDIGVGVLGFAVLRQDTGSNLIDLADKFEHWVIWQLAKGKLALGDVSRIGLSKDSVAVAGDNATGVQGGPEIVGYRLVAQVTADGFLHFLEPVQHFLVCPGRWLAVSDKLKIDCLQSMKRASKTIETGSE